MHKKSIAFAIISQHTKQKINDSRKLMANLSSDPLRVDDGPQKIGGRPLQHSEWIGVQEETKNIEK
jgi:hypothetical protein